MPTLKLTVDLPDYLYQEVQALTPEERESTVIAALRVATISTPRNSPPVKTPLLTSFLSSLDTKPQSNGASAGPANSPSQLK